MSPNTKPIPRGTNNLSVNVPVSDAIATARRAGFRRISRAGIRAIAACPGADFFASLSLTESNVCPAFGVVTQIVTKAPAARVPSRAKVREAIALVRASAHLDDTAADMAQKASA